MLRYLLRICCWFGPIIPIGLTALDSLGGIVLYCALLLIMAAASLYNCFLSSPESLARMAGVHFVAGCAVWTAFASYVLYTVGGLSFALLGGVLVFLMVCVVGYQGEETWS